MSSQDYHYYPAKSSNTYSYSTKPQQKRKFYTNKKNKKSSTQFQPVSSNLQGNLPENHEPNLTCLQKCTKFSLSINTQPMTQSNTKSNGNMNWKNKNTNILLEGKINFIKQKNLAQSYPGLNLEENILKCLPIDMNEHQRFALNPKIPKLPLFIQFEVPEVNTDLNNFSDEYLVKVFEIDFNAKLHDLNLFKRNVNFAAKGYDISKGIVHSANSFSISKDSTSLPNKSNGRIFEIEASIWKSQQISFSVFFNISLATLKNINFAYMNHCSNIQVIQNYLFDSDIRITKILLKYFLPLTVFLVQPQNPIQQQNYSNSNMVVPYTQKNQPQISQNNNSNINNTVFNPQTITNLLQNINSSYNNFQNNYQNNLPSAACLNQILSSNFQNFSQSQNLLALVSRLQQSSQMNFGSNFNYSNFHTFMTMTTPVIFETEDLGIKDIFNAFYKYSLFGINCLYKLNTNVFTQVKYRPFLNTLFLELQEGAVNIHDMSGYSGCLPSNMTANTDNSSSLDNSFTNMSGGIDEKKSFTTSDSGHNYICIKDDNCPLYRKSNMFEEVRKLMSEYPYLEDLKLKDIKEGSYFSVIYAPTKSAQPPSNKNLNLIECEKHSIFEVFYQMRHKNISNKGQHMKVIGIKERDKQGNVISSVYERYFDYFWFINRSAETNQYYYFEQDLNANRQLYLSYVQNILNVGNF